MICPICNTPNPDGAVFCQNCNTLLPTPEMIKRHKTAAILHAIAIAILIPLLYYFAMSVTSTLWAIRYLNSKPAGTVTTEEFSAAMNHASGYLNIIFSCVCLLIASIYFTSKHRSIISEMNIRRVPAEKIASAFLCGLTLQIPIGFVISMIPFPEGIVEGHNELMNACTSPMWIQFIYGVILAPVIEELFFRGIAHDRLAKTMPVPVAAALSSLGFALIHVEPLAVIVAFVCGYVFALLYSRFGSVLVTIPFYMGFNLLSYALMYITDPTMLAVAGIASVVIFIGSTYVLLHKRKTDE